MKILLLSIGSRGDIEPFLAIGELLQEKGHKVTCAFPDSFKSLTEKGNLPFISLGKNFLKLLNSKDGKIVIGGCKSKFKKIWAFIRLAKVSLKINKELIFTQETIIENSSFDLILFNIKALYPFIWNIKTKGKIILISPVPYLHYVKNHAHIALGGDYGNILNKLTYTLANAAIAKMIKRSIKQIKQIKKIPSNIIRKALSQVPTIYTISPTLFKTPSNWEDHLKILGFHERIKSKQDLDHSEMNKFLASHTKTLFITFGSMVNSNPKNVTTMFLEILEKHNIPAIICTSNGAFCEPKKYNKKMFFFCEKVSYDQIFPKIHGVIHHGGAGTTHSSLKYGCSTLIIPHIVDQYLWNDLVDRLHAGPKGISINKLTKKGLETKILDLFFNAKYKKNATKIGAKMQKENFRQKLYHAIING